jgi:16S rRNA (guanine527-N7)-methyltransferase
MSPEKFLAAFNVSHETISRLQVYHDTLVKWQKAINLVSPKTMNEIWERHFADSAQLSVLIPEGASIADLGSGAGFPGLVLAVMRPDLQVSLIESDNRKSEFLKNVSRETKSPVTVYNDRVERVLSSMTPQFFTARAFAPLTEILGMIPESCRGATLLLLKGKIAREEAEEAGKHFAFDFEEIASKTDPEARILKVTFRK